MSDHPYSVDKEIENISRSLSRMTDDHPSRPLLLVCLGRSHLKRFELLEGPDDATKAIEYTTSALTLTPDGDPLLLSLLGLLGLSHGHRFKRLGELEDVEKAIEYASLALALTPDGDPKLPERLGELGVIHCDRFGRLGQPYDLDTAIEYKSRALALTPDDHSDLPYRLYSLGASYLARFQHLDRLDDVENGIKYTSRAIFLTPDGNTDVSTWLSNLGTAYSLRFKLLGEVDDLQKSVEYQSRALASIPNEHPNKSPLFTMLAVSHKDRFERIGDLDDLDKAIEYESCALALTPTGHPLLSACHANLGVFHIIRFERLREFADLERAIECHSRALEFTPDDHPLLPLIFAALGVALQTRYESLRKPEDLEKAIEYQSRGIGLTLEGHPALPRRLGNMALSHRTRFDKLHDPEDLEKAVEYETRALKLTPGDHSDVSTRLNNLGATYITRFQHFGVLGDLKKAVDYQSEALAVTPDDHPDLSMQNHNLGKSYLLLYQRTGDASYCPSGLACFRSATKSVTGHPRIRFDAALDWTRLASQCNALNPLEAYQTAIDILPQFIWLGASTNQRYRDLQTAESLAVNAAYAAISYSDYPMALEWLEHARCVVWSQSLMLRLPLDQLRSSNSDLADRLDTVSSRLHIVSSERLESRALGAERVAQEHHRLAKEYNQLLNEARALPGFDEYLHPMKACDFVHAAKNGPVAVINCHKAQCDALLILPGSSEVQHIPLPKFSHKMAQDVWADMRKTLSRKGLRERRPYFARQPGDDSGFEDGLRLIWYGIVSPILDHLGYIDNAFIPDLPHITWCPTGPISFLPLHAAGDYNQPQSRVYNYVVSSYTPTLTALLVSSPSSLNASSKVLGVCQEATPGHTELPGTKKELMYVESHTREVAQYTPLMNNDATPSAVLDAMEQHDWVHLACHAHQNISNSTESGFFLQGGTMTLNFINRRSFRNKGLAFLSACQTAKGDEKLPDEAIHLASGMLMAGYTSVIGTMWSVHDDDAPLVADKVYEQLMKEGKVGNGEAGKALHYAVAKLRDKVGENEFGRWVPYIHIGS